ncbi:protein tesmin/TSO1-like CXC 2 [Ananas comosus]|uniref:Protein tesmin/TSO1-like CXC 2 n=1 Tax=Ananas comosus TaxID=4615 RepID=A0A6P5FI82_ANACO|nr:protein tesmin/TSO1-like CXC 2 [Ananas comosus]
MDTPERSTVGAAAISKFEDSPVFNFINSLSPIQMVKSIDSVQSIQAYQSLNFASIPSIFTSPHANTQKDSKLSARNPFKELSEQETSSVTCLLNEALVDPPDDSSIVPTNLPQPLQFDGGSPNHSTTPRHGAKTDHVQSNLNLFQSSLDKRKSLFAPEREIGENHPANQENNEVVGLDWTNLMSDNVDDLLIYNLSIEVDICRAVDGKQGLGDVNYSDFFSSKYAGEINDSQKTQPDVLSAPCVQNVTENPHVLCDEMFGKEDDMDHTPEILSGGPNQVVPIDHIQENLNEASDCIPLGYKVDSQQQRGMRRRCLVFEAAGLSKKNTGNVKPRSAISITSKGKMASYDSHLNPLKTPSPRVLPGIGLHLNALATTSKDRMVTQDTLASGKQLISMPCTIGSFVSTGQKTESKSQPVAKDFVHTGSEFQEPQVMNNETSPPTVLENAEESSPKKKRRKLENGEGESCKRCSCKKSKCLKLYCECFAAGVYCSEPCACQGCFNKPIHEETVLSTRKQIESRNPLAFAPKVIRTSETGQELGEVSDKTPASARHKRGCNCKKSSCLKKYCECYQGGVGCSISCRCEACKNAFGRKDGSTPGGAEEIEHGEEEKDAHEKKEEMPDDGQQNASVQNHENHSSENLAITPFKACRQLVKLSYFSSSKPPRPSAPTGYFSRLYNTQALLKSEAMLLCNKFENHVNNFCDDDTANILKENGSPSNVMKTSSPNGKRISPSNGVGFSPSRKGGRKLILRSIPSFPSLSNVDSDDAVNDTTNSFNPSTLT